MSYRDDHLCEFRGRLILLSEHHKNHKHHRAHAERSVEEHKASKTVTSEFKVDAVSQMDRPYLPYIPQMTPFVRSPSCEIGSAWSKYRNLLLDVGSDPEESRQTQRMNVLFNKINDPSKAGITPASLVQGLNSLGLTHVDLTEADSLLRELLKSPESRSVSREAFYDFMSGLLCGEELHWDAIPHIEGDGLKILQRNISAKKEAARLMQENIKIKIKTNKEELSSLTKDMKSLQKKHGAASTREMEKIEKRIKRRMKEMQIKESQLVILLEEEKTVQGRSTSLLQEANILQNLADRVMQYKSLGAHVAMLTSIESVPLAHGKHSSTQDEEVVGFIIESKVATGSWTYVSFEVEPDWRCFEVVITALHGTAYLSFANPPLIYRAASGSLFKSPHVLYSPRLTRTQTSSGWQRGPGFLVKRSLAKTGYYGMEHTVRIHLSPTILLSCYPGGFGRAWQGSWHLGVHGPSSFKISVIYFKSGSEGSKNGAGALS
ncbi:hypothetical protein GUITHDRAFT_113969 [Guillardia theta CCMP2712]|uniref:Uncharacterized protein n=1 Tax=Guillardia theta (strain CCMP2712) TaxID=905079 RepID=L1IV50_GUITC|nr:hypothetical protein GUITHDRAFT_113969 [Guillardia theta CCMP2712]EKX39977.1 hypothetical protein GUITHDRAFT_113969 [Guillardia theta CCMP2712]|eukprot:XP_005826957.1 hypothetical protein GUITHDRAFT_113969 [Guillardia theta CCMP2712]